MKEIVKSKLNTLLLPVIENLAAKGMTEADVGLILGYSGRNPVKFFEKISERYPEIGKAFEIGKNLADTELVTTAFEIATGYNYKEVVKEYIWVDEDELDVLGEPTGETTRVKTLNKEKTYKRHIKPDTSMLKLLLISRLPEQFTESRKASDGDPLDGADVTESEIRRAAGSIIKVLDSLRTKKIVSKEVSDSE